MNAGIAASSSGGGEGPEHLGLAPRIRWTLKTKSTQPAATSRSRPSTTRYTGIGGARQDGREAGRPERPDLAVRACGGPPGR